MQKHLDVDEHCFRLQKDSAYDSVKRKWAAPARDMCRLMTNLQN